MSHTARAIVVHCMDFRFAKGLAQYVADQGLVGDADIVGWAGAGKAFLDDTSKDFALLQVELSHKLHGITEVHVINHIDCGAYGGSKALGAFDQEHAFQVAELGKVRAVIAERFPHLTFVGHLARLNERGISVEKVTL
jgi:hypothetical protein